MITAGIDIGSDSIRLTIHGKGVVFDEPSAVALDSKGRALAAGEKALEMNVANEDVRIVYPLAQEQIDLKALDALLEEVCYECRVFRMFQKTVLFISYPTSLPDPVAEDLKDHLCQLGASQVYFDEEIWMSAIGAQLDLLLPVASCVMNIGHSNSDIALFYNGKMILKESCNLNGKYIAQLLEQWFAAEHNMIVSPSAIDALKRNLGNVRMNTQPLAMNVNGLDRTLKTLKSVVVDENQMAVILAPFSRQLAMWIQSFINSVPQQYKRDIYERGIVSSGGSMKIKGLGRSLTTMVGVPVHITDNPANTVVQGLEILMSRTAEGRKKS
ncbi:MAG: rod shape-determining protein [Ileibacterium sp.]|nr:rod shape-determining protein [Ileibacterium sp.]